jgi:glucose/arabinose dehydrogenase
MSTIHDSASGTNAAPASDSDSASPPAPGQPPRPPRRKIWIALAVAFVVLAALAAGGAWYAGRHQALAPASTTPPAPTTSAAPAVAVSKGRAPAAPLQLPAGYIAHVFADGLGVARDLQFTPGGTLLISDPKANTVTALPDHNHDGVADAPKVVLRGTPGNDTVQPGAHGLAFHDGKLYVAETARVVRYNWDEASLTATLDRELFRLPTPGGNHGRRTLAFDTKGNLYVSVGSTCNVCRESDPRYATVLISDADGNNPHVFAAGLRNAPFLALNPTSGEIWTTEMGRDELGDNIPPDEINILRAGANNSTANYGWPICYDDRIHDTQFDKAQYLADPCAQTIPPLFKVPAHNAPLGLAFIASSQFPAGQQGDLLVSYHGSWNRTVPDGYKVVRLTVRGNTVTGSTDFITGFISADTRTVSGRPVDLTFDAAGNLYLSDDKTGAVYIIQRP